MNSYNSSSPLQLTIEYQFKKAQALDPSFKIALLSQSISRQDGEILTEYRLMTTFFSEVPLDRPASSEAIDVTARRRGMNCDSLAKKIADIQRRTAHSQFINSLLGFSN